MDRCLPNNFNNVELIKLQLEISKSISKFNVTSINMVKFLQDNLKIELTNKNVIQNVLKVEKETLQTLNQIYGKHFPNKNSQNVNKIQCNFIETNPIVNSEINLIENQNLKKLYLEKLNSKDHKRNFQVYYMFKNKIKRMYRIDCMTRKINVNFFHYLKDNFDELKLNEDFLEFFKSNIRYTSREKFQEFNKKYPQFTEIYNNYLKSNALKKLVHYVKKKYDNQYQKLFFRHCLNFLNFYLKEFDSIDILTNRNRNKSEGDLTGGSISK